MKYLQHCYHHFETIDGNKCQTRTFVSTLSSAPSTSSEAGKLRKKLNSPFLSSFHDFYYHFPVFKMYNLKKNFLIFNSLLKNFREVSEEEIRFDS